MRRPHAWLLACTIAAPWATRAQSPAAPPIAAAESAATGPGLRWVVPPIYWTGQLAFDLRFDRGNAEPLRRQQLLTARVDLSSYLYAPWLATIGGHVGLTEGRSAGGLASQGANEPRTHDEFLTGGLRLSLFPRSRFPAEFRYEVSDTRIDSSLNAGIDYRARNLQVTQRYRPVDNSFALSASYEHRSQSDPQFGQDSQDSLVADFSASWKRHQLAAALSRSDNRRRATEERSEFASVLLRHSYVPDASLSVESSANWAQSIDHLVGSQQRDLTLAQWSSTALWRPPERPVTVTASARGVSSQGTGASVSDVVALGVGASYEFSRNLRLSGNLSATREGGSTELSTVGALGASLQGDQHQWGPATWDWFAGASLSAARHNGESEGGLAGQVGHTFTRVWPLSEENSVSASASQVASVSQVTGASATTQGSATEGLSRALVHTVYLNWSQRRLAGSAFSRLSLTDARQLDGDHARLRMLNLQVSGTHDFDRRRSLSGDLSLQYVQQAAMSLPDPHLPGLRPPDTGQSTRSMSGELTWRQLRVFDVPQLRFNSRLRLASDVQRQRNELIPLPERETASLENSLDYRVGRLDSSLSLRLSSIEGRQRWFVMWRVQRNFGGSS